MYLCWYLQFSVSLSLLFNSLWISDRSKGLLDVPFCGFGQDKSPTFFLFTGFVSLSVLWSLVGCLILNSVFNYWHLFIDLLPFNTLFVRVIIETRWEMRVAIINYIILPYKSTSAPLLSIHHSSFLLLCVLFIIEGSCPTSPGYFYPACPSH